MSAAKRLVGEAGAEALGTMLLTLFGTGSVASAVLTGSLQGLWQVAVVWGCGVALSIYVTSSISGAHLNPAVTVALVVRRGFPPVKACVYIAAQVVGAILAGCCVLLVFQSFLTKFEEEKKLVRGQPGSQLSAMVFGEYFPNPASFGTDAAAHALVSPLLAVVVEAFGTMILMIVILATTDGRSTATGTAPFLPPVLIGATVSVLISVFAPITQAGWNPARDFGPRVVAALAGWGTVAIPGPRAGFWVYIVGPLIGAPLGAVLYDMVVGTALQRIPRQQPRGDRQYLEKICRTQQLLCRAQQGEECCAEDEGCCVPNAADLDDMP